MEVDSKKDPSYAGFNDAIAGELEVAARSFRVESRGDVGNLTDSGALEVFALTRYLPPSGAAVVRLIRESNFLRVPGGKIRISGLQLNKAHPLLVCISS